MSGGGSEDSQIHFFSRKPKGSPHPELGAPPESVSPSPTRFSENRQANKEVVVSVFGITTAQLMLPCIPGSENSRNWSPDSSEISQNLEAQRDTHAGLGCKPPKLPVKVPWKETLAFRGYISVLTPRTRECDSNLGTFLQIRLRNSRLNCPGFRGDLTSNDKGSYKKKTWG